MILFHNIQAAESAPVTEPVSLSDLKEWMQVDFEDHDDLITSMGVSARQDIEEHLQVKLVGADITVALGVAKAPEPMYQLPWAFNVSQVSEMKAWEVVNGEEDTELTPDEGYYLNTALTFTRCGNYKITYTVTPVVPDTVKEAIKMLVAYRYNNRGDQDRQQGLPTDIVSKLRTFKQIWL